MVDADALNLSMPYPTSNPPAPLSQMPVAPAVLPQDSLSAIGKLQILQKQGVLSGAEILGWLNDVPGKTAGAEAAIADNAKDSAMQEMAIRPAQTQFNLENLGAETSLIQPRAKSTLSGYKLKDAVDAETLKRLPGQSELEGLKTEGDAISQREMNEWLKKDPTGASLETYKLWRATGEGGEIPRLPDGSPDINHMANSTRDYKFSKEFAGSKTSQELYEIAGKKGEAGYKILSEVLERPTEANVAAAVAALGKLPDASAKDIDAIVATEDEAAWADHAKELIANKDLNPVGPITGSWAGQGEARALASFGNDGKYNAQSQLRQGISKQVLKAGALLKGSTSNKDMEFLKASVPRLSDTPAVWNSYLDDLKAAIARGREYRKANGAITSAEAPGAPGATAERVHITSMEQWKNLAPNTKYIDSQGNPGTKR